MLSSALPTIARPNVRRRAGIALAVLPLVAMLGCAQAKQATRASVESEMNRATDNIANSTSLSVTMAFDDSKGTLKKGLLSDANPPKPALIDSVLGGKISMTIDPAGSRTMKDLQTSSSTTAATADQLKAVNMAFSVSVDGGPLAEIRLVDGDLFARVDLDRIKSVTAKSGGGSADQLSSGIDDLESSAPAQLKQLVTDVRAGKWVKVPFAKYADQLAQLSKTAKGTAPTPTPSVDSQKLGADLMAAVKPFVQVTDAGGDQGKRVLTTKVQARQALRAVLDTLKRSLPVGSALDQVDTGLTTLRDGTVNGTITLQNGHLSEVTTDLQSILTVAPADPSVPDLTGSSLKLSFDDSASAVQTPTEVSSYDVGALMDQLLNAAAGAAGAIQPS